MTNNLHTVFGLSPILLLEHKNAVSWPWCVTNTRLKRNGDVTNQEALKMVLATKCRPMWAKFATPLLALRWQGPSSTEKLSWLLLLSFWPSLLYPEELYEFHNIKCTDATIGFNSGNGGSIPVFYILLNGDAHSWCLVTFCSWFSSNITSSCSIDDLSLTRIVGMHVVDLRWAA